MTSPSNLADAVISWQRGDYDRTRRICVAWLQFSPQDVEALNLLAMASAHLGDADAAVDTLQRAIALRPEDLSLHNNLGGAFLAAGRPEEALDAFRRVVAELPGHADGYFNLGNAQQKAGRWSEAIVEYGKAIAIDPKHARAHYQTGNALRQRGEAGAAIAAYDNALQLVPEFVEALQNQAGCLLETQQYSAAANVSRRLIRSRPELAEAHFTLGAALQGMGMLDEAQQSFAKAQQLQPANPRYFARLWRCRRHMAASLSDQLQSQRLRTLIDAAGYAQPEWIPDIAEDAAQARHYSTIAARSVSHPAVPSLHLVAPRADGRIRVALIGTDLASEACTTFLNRWLRTRTSTDFEVLAIELSRLAREGDAAALRPQVDQWVEAGLQSDVDIARWLRDSEIDIAIDLHGQGAGARSAILAMRPARVQVQYLGFGGTSGSANLDYLIADDVLVPEADSAHYTEQLVCLPSAYDIGPILPRGDLDSHRSRFKLPVQGPLFCHAGPIVGLHQETFECWMRILQQTPGSSLCLTEENRWVAINLKQRAVQSAVSADRIFFSQFASAADRLLWLSAMDVYLTVPQEGSAHLLAAALRHRVPCVAIAGATFWARQAASLLHAGGQAHRIAADIADYERLACEAARCRQLGESIPQQSVDHDAAGFPRYFEAALRAMHEIDTRGEAPRPIRIRWP